jgi:hypothetical protein
MGARASRLSSVVAASTPHAVPSSTAATPPQFLAAQKASAVIDASRRALSDCGDAPKDPSVNTSSLGIANAVGAVSPDERSARLQDALGRGGGGGLDGDGAVTEEQLRAAYSMQMVLQKV